MSKEQNTTRHLSKKRLAILYLMIGLLLCLCIGRAVWLVMKKGSEYEQRALRQASGYATEVLARPGNIMSANGTFLATSRKVYRMIFDPKVLFDTEELYKGSYDATLSMISEVFGAETEELDTMFTENSESRYLRYKNEIYEEASVTAFREAEEQFESEKSAYNKTHSATPRRSRIAGVWFEEEYRRAYPLKDTASKVIGFTTRDASQGIIGLELYYNSELHGVNGRSYSYINENGETSTEVVPPVDGYTLVTSLDENVSRVIRECIAEFQQEIGGKRINVLAMDPNTGEIIAMESDTEFDLTKPTDLTQLFTEEELENPADLFLLQEAFRGRMEQLENMTHEEQLQALLQQVQMNYSISGTFEPGSTSKLITLAAGLEEKIITPQDTFYCDGEIQVGKYTIHCHMGTLCGDLNPMEALGRSCNVCLVRIGEKIGAKTFSRYQEIFNLGQKTGIDLPGEANTQGLIHYENSLGEVELATCSFGQGFNVSMVQFASAYASVLNGGKYYRPHVVREILDADGNTIKKFDPELIRNTISEQTAEYLKECLHYVTIYGTATTAPSEGYTLAGKTGAAEKLPRGTGKYIVSFIGGFPADAPKILVYTVVDEPYVEDQSMSMPAQILAHKIYEKLYSYYNVYPEDEEDAYQYDWKRLRNAKDTEYRAAGKSFIDDPGHILRWIGEISEPAGVLPTFEVEEDNDEQTEP